MNLTSLFGMITPKQESPCIFRYKGFSLKKTATTYSPTVTQYHRRD